MIEVVFPLKEVREMVYALTRPYHTLARMLETASFDAFVSKHGMARAQALEMLRPLYLDKFLRLREHINGLGNSPEEKRTLFAVVDGLIERLRTDSAATLEVAHRAGLQHFENAIEFLRVYLPEATKCRELLDSASIGTFCGRLPKKAGSHDTIANALALLEQCPIAFPYRAGFNASVQWQPDTFPLISRFHGVADCLDVLAELVVSYCTEPVGDDGVRIVELQTSPRDFEEVTGVFRRAIGLVSGDQLSVEFSSQPYNQAQRHLLTLLSGGAEHFVWFHEFAHILTAPIPDSRQNELQCDEFGIRLMVAAGNAESIIGVGLGLLSMAAWVHTSVGELSATHPHPMDRMKQYMTIIDEERARFDGRKVDQYMEFFTIPLAILEAEGK